jgi:spermidine/putrescine transport system substrate-binding protein
MNLRMLGAGLAALVLLGAGAARAEGELHIYNWGDYTNPELIKKFEETYKVKVTLDDYDSNETMLAKVRAGASGFDIVVPTDYTAKIMIEEGMLAKTEPNKMDNFKHLDPKFVDAYWDPGRSYTVPWDWGTTAFAVDTEKYKGDINTLALMFQPPAELKGRINVLDDMNSLFNAGLRYLGLPRCNDNPADLKKLHELLVAAKQDWRTFDYDTIGKMTSGDVDLTQTWNGAAMRIRLQRPTVAYAFPKEGIEGWMDNVAVLKDAPNLENAKLFQNFIMDPENAALIAVFNKYSTAIMDTGPIIDKLDPQYASAPEFKVPEGLVPEFVPPCSKEVTDKYNRIWTDLKK